MINSVTLKELALLLYHGTGHWWHCWNLDLCIL